MASSPYASPTTPPSRAAGAPERSMATATTILLVALAVAGAGAAAYWSIALAKIAQGLRNGPSLRDHARSAAPEGAPGVCIVAPAHNERGAIGDLVRSLRRQDYPSLGVVLALDRCTDDTRDVAQRAIDEPLEGANGAVRFEIIEIERCPEEWAGKTHAAWHATRHAALARGAPMLLYADADTVFDPACVRAAVSLLRERGLGLLSLLSTLTSRRWHERTAQPVAAFELMRQYPIQNANDWPEPRPFANGQFMLFTREVYDDIGGHESVKHDLLEDIALARLVAKRGHRPGLAIADGLLVCDMYDDWGAFVRGWKRIFTEACNRRVDRLRQRAIRLFLTDVALPLAGACALLVGVAALVGTARVAAPLAATLTGAAATAMWLLAWGAVMRAQHVPARRVLNTPLGGVLVTYVMLAAAYDLSRGHATHWGGRAYRRERRAGGVPKQQTSAGAVDGDSHTPDAR
ncbi:MAG: glycosyltransferase [Phycisphaerales bacterium]|nr:MAG: glycosyltransferase [Phycisphaerales bacterium]